MAGERPIFAEDESGRLVPMSPAAPPSEDELQQLIAEHPDIVGETEGELLFLSREQPVADSEGGAGRWSLDHLFVTRGAVPVLLEVKRATDGRLRREVVGQLLDYAANGKAYWPAGTLEKAFRTTCARRGEDPDERLVEFLGEGEMTEFWNQVETNLAAGRVRLVFAADLIPPELARVIEFLNDQMRAEVRGVELRYYRSAAGRRTLVPRIVGLTERTKAVKGDGSQVARSASIDAWLEQLQSEHGEMVAEPARQVIALCGELGAQLVIIAGNVISVGFDIPGVRTVKPMQLKPWGRLEFSLKSLNRLSGWVNPTARQDWLDRLGEEVGGLTHQRAETWPRLPLDRLTGDRWTAFEALFRELVDRMRSS